MRFEKTALVVLAVASGALAGCYHGSARNVSAAQLRSQAGWVVVPAMADARQVSAHDCGPTALSMVLQRWGVPASSRVDLEKALPPSDKASGFTARDLRDLARQRGLRAFLISGRVDDLIHEISAGRPVLVGLIQRYGNKALAHYEVVIGYNPVTKRLLLHDPANGPREDGFDGFGAEWKPTGYVTLVVTGWAAPPPPAAHASGT